VAVISDESYSWACGYTYEDYKQLGGTKTEEELMAHYKWLDDGLEEANRGSNPN